MAPLQCRVLAAVHQERRLWVCDAATRMTLWASRPWLPAIELPRLRQRQQRSAGVVDSRLWCARRKAPSLDCALVASKRSGRSCGHTSDTQRGREGERERERKEKKGTLV